MTKTQLGTELYMAPEIMENREYNFSVDMWSIGIILFEILFGVHPFKSQNSNFLCGNFIKNLQNLTSPKLNFDKIFS